MSLPLSRPKPANESCSEHQLLEQVSSCHHLHLPGPEEQINLTDPDPRLMRLSYAESWSP
jgi:hypothetical protein